jgi:hypothetical protein
MEALALTERPAPPTEPTPAAAPPPCGLAARDRTLDELERLQLNKLERA